MTQVATGKPRNPSQEQAENFHVLPKRDAAREQAKEPQNADIGSAAIVERDVEAGSLTGSADVHTNQTSRPAIPDRSQVS